jgi:hypothetical protein
MRIWNEQATGYVDIERTEPFFPAETQAEFLLDDLAQTNRRNHSLTNACFRTIAPWSNGRPVG